MDHSEKMPYHGRESEMESKFQNDVHSSKELERAVHSISEFEKRNSQSEHRRHQSSNYFSTRNPASAVIHTFNKDASSSSNPNELPTEGAYHSSGFFLDESTVQSTLHQSPESIAQKFQPQASPVSSIGQQSSPNALLNSETECVGGCVGESVQCANGSVIQMYSSTMSPIDRNSIKNCDDPGRSCNNPIRDCSSGFEVVDLRSPVGKQQSIESKVIGGVINLRPSADGQERFAGPNLARRLQANDAINRLGARSCHGSTELDVPKGLWSFLEANWDRFTINSENGTNQPAAISIIWDWYVEYLCQMESNAGQHPVDFGWFASCFNRSCSQAQQQIADNIGRSLGQPTVDRSSTSSQGLDNNSLSSMASGHAAPRK